MSPPPPPLPPSSLLGHAFYCNYKPNHFDIQILAIDDKVEVLNALTNIQSRYYEIGTQLHLKALDTVKNRITTDTVTMSEVVEEWLKRNYDTTRFGPQHGGC